ncbi:MAG TPA: hypothetical protein V6C97_30695 [Oculatellaceae cyanobacterium]
MKRALITKMGSMRYGHSTGRFYHRFFCTTRNWPKGRRASGQALVEGVAMMVILMGIFVSALMMFINLGVVVSEQQKVQVAATQAAHYIMGQRYWLGAQRTDYNANTTSSNARQIADGVLHALNLPASSSFTTVDTPSSNGVTVSTVTIGVAGLPLLNGATLPFPISATSAASTAEDISQGWRAVSIQCADPNNPADQTQWRTAMVPCYNYIVGTVNSQSSPIPFSKLNGPSVMGAVTVVRSDTGPCTISQNQNGPSTQW